MYPTISVTLRYPALDLPYMMPVNTFLYKLLLAALTCLVLSVALQAVEKADFVINDDKSPAQQNNPRIAVAPDGSFMVTWVDRRNSTADIYMQKFDSNAEPVGRNLVVNDIDTTYQFQPAVSTDLFSRYSTVWIDYREGSYPFSPNIFLQPYDSAIIALDSNLGLSLDVPSSSKEAPDISLSSWGKGVVVWSDYRNGNWDIFGQMISSDGDMIGGNFIVNDDIDDAQQHAPKVSTSPEGWFVVTWYDNRLGDDDIFAQRFDSSGNALGVNIKLNDDTTATRQSFPDIATDGAGHFTVVWVDWRNGDYPINPDIYSCRMDTFMVPITENIRINSDETNRAQREPAISADRMGNVAIIWADSTGTSWDINGQMIDVDGVVREENFLANNFEDSAQLHPDVALDGQYRYVTWADNRNGNFDIYASIEQYNERSLIASPATIDFQMPVGGNRPDPIIMAIEHGGYNSVGYQISGGADWLTIDKTTGQTPDTVTLSINSLSMSAGTYLATLTVVDTQTMDSTTVVGVRFTVSSPILEVSPDTLFFVGHLGISQTIYQNISINNLGDGQLDWQIDSRPYWATVTPASGVAPATPSVAVDANLFTEGEILAPIVVSAPGSGSLPDTVWTKLTIIANTPEIAILPDSIYIETGFLASVDTSVVIKNIGNYSVAWTAVSDMPWMNLSAYSGWQNDTVYLSVSDYSLSYGLYQGHVTFTDPNAYIVSVSVPVVLNYLQPSEPVDTLAFESVEVRPGVTAPLAISLNLSQNINKLFSSIDYDTSLITIDSITFAEILPSYMQYTFEVLPDSGRFALTLNSSSPDSILASGQYDNFATIWFQTSATVGVATLQPSAMSPYLVNDIGTVTSLAITNGQVRVDQPTSANEPDPELPGRFMLYQNYPNPFNAGTVIEFDLPVRSEVELSIFNILGQKVKMLLNNDLPAGNHRVNWDGKFESGRYAPSGIYFYRFQSSDASFVRKMVYLK